MADPQIADLVDHQQRGVAEHRQPALELAGRLDFLQRGDQVDEGAVVQAAAVLRRREGHADGGKGHGM